MRRQIRVLFCHLGWVENYKKEDIEYLLRVRIGESPCSGRGEIENVKIIRTDKERGDAGNHGITKAQVSLKQSFSDHRNLNIIVFSSIKQNRYLIP